MSGMSETSCLQGQYFEKRVIVVSIGGMKVETLHTEKPVHTASAYTEFSVFERESYILSHNVEPFHVISVISSNLIQLT